MIDPVDAIDAVSRELALAPEPAQMAALAQYLALLQRWNATHNLTAIREPAAMLTQHLADCLAAIPPLRRYMTQGRLLDVGSGGGLPGIVVAVMQPDVEVVCVDAVGKKAAFIRQAAGVMGLRNLRAVHARVEDLREAPFEVIASRAFSSLAEFVKLTRRHLGPAGVWLAMKGRAPSEEIAALPADTEVFHVEPLHVPGLDAQRCLVWMRPRHAA